MHLSVGLNRNIDATARNAIAVCKNRMIVADQSLNKLSKSFLDLLDFEAGPRPAGRK
jgi:hypothetical protein